MDIRILCCIGSLLLTANSVLGADIKRWVDSNGQLHFGEHAPHGIVSTQVTPKVTTTTPSSGNTLNKIMRPGELGMIKNHEKRGKRLIKAKREEQKQAKLDQRSIVKAKGKCIYHEQKREQLKRKLRSGYSRSKERRIEQSLAKHNLKIEKYCN